MSDIVQRDPDGTPESAIICLHGLGASSDDFVEFADHFPFRHTHGTRFIFPNAPVQPVSINMGMPMPAWYDIYSPSFLDHMDIEGISDSVNFLHRLIHKQIEDGIPSDRIVIGGFSQGAVISLTAALSADVPLAGCLSMSGYYPLIDEPVHPSNQQCPVLWLHGTQDSVVPYSLAEEGLAVLAEKKIEVEHHAYPVDHTLAPESLSIIENWLADHLGSPHDE